MEPQLAARPPPVAASSQRQEPCEPARHGGTLLGPLVLDPGAPELAPALRVGRPALSRRAFSTRVLVVVLSSRATRRYHVRCV